MNLRGQVKTYKRYLSQISIYFGASLVPMLLSLIANPWIAKNMSPEDYAISGYYTSFSSLISPIILFYFIHYYIKEYFRRSEFERTKLMATIAKALIWFSGIVSVICFLLLLLYIKYIKSGDRLPISPYLAFSVFALPLTGLLNLKLAQFRMSKEAKSYFILSVSNGILNIALSVLFVVLLKWGAMGKLLGPLVCNAIIFLLMLRQFYPLIRIKTTFEEYKTVILFCFPLALSAMLGYFTHGFSTTYLESVGNTTEYGIYVVGSSIGTYLTVFSTAINSTFQPDIYESTIKEQWSRYIKYCVLQIGLISLITLFFVILAPYIISILTAGRYNSSTVYAQIISLSTITSSIYYLINNFSIATNRPKLYLITTIIGSLFIIILMPIFVSQWSFEGGAWLMVLSYILFSIINIILLITFKKSSKSV